MTGTVAVGVAFTRVAVGSIGGWVGVGGTAVGDGGIGVAVAGGGGGGAAVFVGWGAIVGGTDVAVGAGCGVLVAGCGGGWSGGACVGTQASVGCSTMTGAS